MQVFSDGDAARPAARFDKLVVTETVDEVLLYDTEKHHIHHLNVTTAAVWRHADGTRGVADLARLAGQELGAAVDEATVRLALTKLDDAGLLQQSLADELRMSRMSRRAFMQRAGVGGAIAVPAIVSTTAAVSAQSPDQCAGVCGAALDFMSESFEIFYPCDETCTACPWEFAFGSACANAFGTSELTICAIGECTEAGELADAAGVSSLPNEAELQEYAEEVYPELIEGEGTADGSDVPPSGERDPLDIGVGTGGDPDPEPEPGEEIVVRGRQGDPNEQDDPDQQGDPDQQEQESTQQPEDEPNEQGQGATDQQPEDDPNQQSEEDPADQS